MLREDPDAVEADLARFYGIDYRARWGGGLTLRRMWVLVTHLPPESACAQVARGDKPHWSLEAHLLDELRMTWTATKDKPGKPHPDRPRPGKRVPSPDRARKLAAARRRADDRRRAREAGELD